MLKMKTMPAAVAVCMGSSTTNAMLYSMTFMDFPGAQNTTVVGTFNTAAQSGTITSGTTPYFGRAWTGTLVFASTSASSWTYSSGTGSSATGTYNFMLDTGQTAMGILFDWGSSRGIPILNIVNTDGSGVDIDGDGTLGTTMAAGPFAGSPVGFAGQVAVPVPAAVWLFGSGLIGLVGVARRRKAS